MPFSLQTSWTWRWGQPAYHAFIFIRTDHWNDLIQFAEKEVQAGRLSSSLYKRLDLSTGDKYNALLEGVLDVDRLPDPTGSVCKSEYCHMHPLIDGEHGANQVKSHFPQNSTTILIFTV